MDAQKLGNNKSIADFDKELAKQVSKTQKQTQKATRKLQKAQTRLVNKIRKTDSLTAANLQTGLNELNQLQNRADSLFSQGTTPYLARMDSLQTALKYLNTSLPDKYTKPLEELTQLKQVLNKQEALKAWLGNQQQTLTNLIQSNLALPPKVMGAIKKYQVQAGAFKAKIAGLKEKINEPGYVEKETLTQLSKLPAFQKFMQQNGELARLFGGPASGDLGAGFGANAIAGLQTRQGLQTQLQQQFGAAFTNANNGLQQQLHQGMQQVNDLKNGLNALIGDSNAKKAETLALTPAEQAKAKQKATPFFKRFEKGYNLQTGLRTGTYPAINDLALNLGYKINPRSVIGIGVAYKFGLGSIQKIRFSHEGVGFRSFVDWKIAPIVNEEDKARQLFGNWWLSGGFEMNYFEAFTRTELPNLAWQKSGLLGLTKKIERGGKYVKMQVLWDFLKANTTGETGIVWRVGYSF